MKHWYVEFSPNAKGVKAGACCMSYQVPAWTADEAKAVATRLLLSCGEHLDQFRRARAFERQEVVNG